LGVKAGAAVDHRPVMFQMDIQAAQEQRLILAAELAVAELEEMVTIP